MKYLDFLVIFIPKFKDESEWFVHTIALTLFFLFFLFPPVFISIVIVFCIYVFREEICGKILVPHSSIFFSDMMEKYWILSDTGLYEILDCARTFTVIGTRILDNLTGNNKLSQVTKCSETNQLLSCTKANTTFR